MSIREIEVRTLDIPLRAPFRTSQSVQLSRRGMLLKVTTDDAVGWADLSVEDEPIFGHEFIDATWVALAQLLVPAVLDGNPTAPHVSARLRAFVGQEFAKCALEMAVLDADLRSAGLSLATYLGGTRTQVPVGVSVGITDTIEELVGAVSDFLEEGYTRVKLKVQPGWDLVPLRAVRAEFGNDLDLQVDGNGAYRSADLPNVRRWEEFELTMIEQPFAASDLISHTRLAATTSTPICLDESIRSAVDAVRALTAGACSIVNIKPGRVGGYLEARRVHDTCAAMNIPVWCGGMLESGVGRAANLALASLPNFQFPGDISATSRYFSQDVCAPFELVDGMLAVPQGPGIGVDVDPEALERFTVRREVFTPQRSN